MLSSSTFWYSGVSGASWARPQALVGSNLMACPPRRGLMASHCPFQLGYFISAAASKLTGRVVAIEAGASAPTNASARDPAERRCDLLLLPLPESFQEFLVALR